MITQGNFQSITGDALVQLEAITKRAIQFAIAFGDEVDANDFAIDGDFIIDAGDGAWVVIRPYPTQISPSRAIYGGD